MASYCETCEKIFNGKWDNCPECGNVANKLSSTNVKIEKPDKSKKSTKETIPLTHRTDNILSNRDNNRNDTTIDETVSIDEAVSYGFNMFKGIAKYIIYIIILNGIGFFLVAISVEGGGGGWLLGIPLIIAGTILNIALSIGVLYKLWVDILARSRK